MTVHLENKLYYVLIKQMCKCIKMCFCATQLHIQYKNLSVISKGPFILKHNTSNKNKTLKGEI